MIPKRHIARCCNQTISTNGHPTVWIGSRFHLTLIIPGDWAVQRHRSLPTTTRGGFFPFGGTTTARVVQPAAAAVRLLQWTKRSQASLETGVRIALGKRLPCLTATTLLSFCLSLALITGGMAALDHISTLVARAGTCSWLQTISLANLEQKVAKCPGYPHIVMAK